MSRIQLTFLALIVTQAVHSIEEYQGRLYAVFPPARLVSSLVSSDIERGFAVLNTVLVGSGFWCFFWPVRKRWPIASTLMWGWAGIELVNGIGHPAWSVMQGAYTPGVATAPLLFGLALYLARQLLMFSASSRTTER